MAPDRLATRREEGAVLLPGAARTVLRLEAADGQFFDNADQERRVVRTAVDYGAIWDEMVPHLATLSNTILKGPDVQVVGDLALVEVRFATRFEAVTGSVEEVPTLSSLVMRRVDGDWRIFREHGTSLARDDGR